jgi:hypothetical protein
VTQHFRNLLVTWIVLLVLLGDGIRRELLAACAIGQTADSDSSRADGG